MANDDTTINIRLEDEGGKPQGSVDPLKGVAAREPTPPVAGSAVPPSSEKSEVKDKQLGEFQKINLGHIRTIQQIARTVAGMAGFHNHFLNSIFRLSVLAEKFGSVLNKTQAAAEAAGDAARRAGHGRPKEPVPRPSQLPPSGISPSPKAPTSAPVTPPSRPSAEPSTMAWVVRGEGETPAPKAPTPVSPEVTPPVVSDPVSIEPVARGEGKTPGDRVPRISPSDLVVLARSRDPVSPASPSAPRLPAPERPLLPAPRGISKSVGAPPPVSSSGGVVLGKVLSSTVTPLPLHGAKPVPPGPVAAAGGAAAGGGTGGGAVGAAAGAAGAAAGALSLARLASGLTMAGAAIGVVVSGFAALAMAARQLDAAFDRAARELEGFSPEIAVASAERDIGNLIAKMNQAKELGPMLAAQEAIRAEQDLLKIQIQTKILKLLEPMNEVLQESYVALLGIVEKVVDLIEVSGGSEALAKLAADIAGVPDEVQLGVKALWGLWKLAKEEAEEDEIPDDSVESIIMEYLSPKGAQAATSYATLLAGRASMNTGTPQRPINIIP